MKKLFSLIAVALCASGPLAQAQTASTNPFARPTAPATTPGAPGAPGAVPSTGATAMPGGATAPMPGQPIAGAPGMLPPGQPGAYPPPPPGVYSPNSGMPGAPGLPGAAAPSGPETTEEEVSASRIGKVNGMHIYRGQNTYMFESSKNRKVVRRLIPVTSSAMPASSSATNPAEKPQNLPSMVGRPAPSN